MPDKGHMTAEDQLLRIAKLIGFELIWQDMRPNAPGLWFAERNAGPGKKEAAPLEFLISNQLHGFDEDSDIKIGGTD